MGHKVVLSNSSDSVCLCIELIYMDTDFLDLGSDSAAVDDDDPYSRVTGVDRRPVLSSACTLTPGSKPGVSVDKVEPLTTLPAQHVNPPSSTAATLPWPDPPAMHSVSLHSEHYKSPGPVSDGVSAAAVNRPAPELLPKTSAVPAIPPRKPRLATPNPVAGRSETAPSKTTQVQPPLPHFRKPPAESFVNRMYGVSVAENPQQRSVEVNGNPPPVPVPRNIASTNSAQMPVPASSNQLPVSSDGPVPCESLSSDERVCE